MPLQIKLFLQSQGCKAEEYEYLRKTMDNYIFRHKKNNKLAYIRY